jgi:DnaK suppressor protein
MDRDTLNRFKALFESKRERLIYSGRVVNEDFQVKPEDLVDETDLTSSETETGMRMRLRNREALYLKKIDEALGRISSGTFGMCEDCTAPIGLRRLEVRPTATLCLECKEGQEQSERLHIDGHRFKSLGAKMKFI